MFVFPIWAMFHRVRPRKTEHLLLQLIDLHLRWERERWYMIWTEMRVSDSEMTLCWRLTFSNEWIWGSKCINDDDREYSNCVCIIVQCECLYVVSVVHHCSPYLTDILTWLLSVSVFLTYFRTPSTPNRNELPPSCHLIPCTWSPNQFLPPLYPHHFVPWIPIPFDSFTISCTLVGLLYRRWLIDCDKWPIAYCFFYSIFHSLWLCLLYDSMQIWMIAPFQMESISPFAVYLGG